MLHWGHAKYPGTRAVRVPGGFYRKRRILDVSKLELRFLIARIRLHRLDMSISHSKGTLNSFKAGYCGMPQHSGRYLSNQRLRAVERGRFWGFV